MCIINLKSKLKEGNMEQKYKQARGVNLAAGIVDIVIGALAIVGLIYAIAIIARASSSIPSEYIPVFVMSILISAAQVGCMLGFGIATICYAKEKGQAYCDKKPKFLSFAIVESVILFFSFIGVVTDFDPVSLVVLLLMIAVVVLRYIGYAFIAQVSGKLDQEAQQPEVQPAKKEVSNDSINVDKLQKLTELKESGAITEEEYEHLRKKELGL